MELNSRRKFFKEMFGFVGLALLAPTLLSHRVNAEEKRRSKSSAGGALPLAEPGKDTAGNLGYVHKSPHADKKCDNCTFYSANGKIGTDEVGKCQVLPGKNVKAAGYCNSWAKKA